jgi:hypothetical protein
MTFSITINSTRHSAKWYSAVMPSVIHAKCQLHSMLQIDLYDECHYADCHYAERLCAIMTPSTTVKMLHPAQ